MHIIFYSLPKGSILPYVELRGGPILLLPQAQKQSFAVYLRSYFKNLVSQGVHLLFTWMVEMHKEPLSSKVCKADFYTSSESHRSEHSHTISCFICPNFNSHYSFIMKELLVLSLLLTWFAAFYLPLETNEELPTEKSGKDVINRKYKTEYFYTAVAFLWS